MLAYAISRPEQQPDRTGLASAKPMPQVEFRKKCWVVPPDEKGRHDPQIGSHDTLPGVTRNPVLFPKWLRLESGEPL